MIDLHPASVPELGDEWIVSHRAALVEALAAPRRTPLAWAALAGGAGVAATVSSLVLVGGSAPAAFAGWAAAPTTPARGQVSTAVGDCQADLAQAAQLPPSNKDPQDVTGLVPELSDVRGPYTVTVFGNGRPGGALCVASPGATSLRWITSPGAVPVGAGSIGVDQMSVLTREGQPYTLVEGRTGTDVTAVALHLGNGSTVTATSGDGLFVAWWPGSQTIVSAAVTTASGVSTQPVNLPGPAVPGSKPAPPASGASPAPVDPEAG